jgi:prolyl oligopeptidase
MKNTRTFFAFLIVLIFSFCALAASDKPPATEKKPVSDEFYGIKVTDNYRWLENFEDPAVQKWNTGQNAYSRKYLDSNPMRPEIEKRLNELLSSRSVSYYGLIDRGGLLFASKFEPPREQPFVITLKSAMDAASEQIVLDPTKLDSSGSTAIDFYVPSLDGHLIAAALSKSGSEAGGVRIYETETGKALPDVIERVQYPTAGGSVAWTEDGTGIYYTRYPAPGERPEEDMHFYQQVYFHELGTPPDQDRYVIGKDFPKIAEVELHNSDDGKYILATVANGDGGEFEHFLMDPSGEWKRITHFSDKITRVVFGPDDSLYLLSHKDALRGKLLKLGPGKTDLAGAKTLIPEGDSVLARVVPTANRLYVVDMVGGPSQIRVLDKDGKELNKIPMEPVAAVGQALRTAGDTLLFNEQSYVTPTAWFQYDPETGKAEKTQLFSTSPADFSDAEVLREFATSKDGTKVPINIIMKKGTKLNGQNPTILYGYGGYGISMTPGFSSRRRLWLDFGGIYAIANIRGGGEYGEAWHLAGNLTKKQNVFDDFIACAEYLIQKKYTSASRLAIEGGSNGGLLMGAVMTQRPELFRAVVSYVGIYDMLRVENSPNGVFNITEFGTVKNPDQFKAIYAYSPYHHVQPGTAYPAVLFMTGDHDGRVDPANSRKMTAEMQATTSSDRPILLRTSSKAGHGIGTALSERIAQEADVYCFLFDQLGISKKK